jgi:glutamate dehydrogenase
MILTSDPQRRAARLKDVLELVSREAPAEDRALLTAFVPVVFGATPDRVVFGLSVEALAARMRDHFGFFVREMPPATQLYRGLPGIHVSVRNPEEAGWVSRGKADGLPHEITVVETHTHDAPFIFESLKNYLTKAGLRVFSAVHPIFTVQRQWERIVSVGGPHDDGSKESYCYFQIERIDSRERRRHVEHEIFSVLKCLFISVEDFEEMQRTVREASSRLASRSGKRPEVDSARAFLHWLLADNYIFQGILKYRPGPDGLPDRIHESALGVFTDAAVLPVVFPGLIERVEQSILPRSDDERIVEIDYCHNAYAIYHLDPIDDIVIRQWGNDGSLAEATLLLGRFAKGAFTQKAADIPLLHDKQEYILANSGAVPKSHEYRETRALFNRLPTRELFYADARRLKELIDRIVYMTGDDEIAVFSRPGNGYVALAIAFSRLRYSYTVEQALAQRLADEFGPVTFSTSADCGTVSLLLYYFDAARLEHPIEEARVRELTRSLVTTWEDRAMVALEQALGEREGRRLFRRYVRLESRSGLYREATPPEEVPGDITHLENLEGRLEARILPRAADRITLKLFSLKPVGLTETLRMLHNLGLTVTEDLKIPLTLPEGRKGFLYRLEIDSQPARIAALLEAAERFVDTLRALDEGRASDDALNGLVLDAGLHWREVELLRTLRNHLTQIRTHYNADTVNGVLLRNSAVASALVRLFVARFDPALPGDRANAVAQAEAGVAKAFEQVKSLAEDEVLRGLDNLIRAALRTNFYQRPERPVFSVKIESRKVEGMPSPRPMFEVYVHSRLLQGIHLRGGKVARGGIRWSDRHDDFRTEVLGLMKTQMVKNSIIVPVGSKGGFVLKGELPPRPALDACLVDRYREFVSGLLDITDNIVDGKVLHPPEVVFHDGDDPYLVVAADKGTAHLSDTANSVSGQYGFWLGDAFASGGSVGYDHKKMGITAKGAWECVKHHFRNLGMDIQREPFTAAGIGDMSGDVFGNGALLSSTMKLVAAFNHVHIFIDPDPDPGASFDERKRLFAMPRSSWRDYDPKLISRGGGVFERSAKSIPLSPEVKKLLEIDADSASGEEVIRRILTAHVDLLYNGGIGTYVKASAEEDADVGDRANDRVRVNANEVRARVVGEGGNLGFTQRARLEYWAAGGQINTDAVDNSGGVDTSDHEVNIKILLDLLVKKGVIRNKAERNRILSEMTDEVAGLVLADNRHQALALSLDGLRSAARYEEFVNLLDDMLGAGVLNRADDAIPRRSELLASPERKRGLPRPLLALLLGHTKMLAFEMVMQTDFPDSASGESLLFAYFPRRLRESFSEHFKEHALRREIVATAAVNSVVNLAGISFLSRMQKASGKGIGEVVAAYLEVDRATDAPRVRSALYATTPDARTEQETLLAIEDVLEPLALQVLEGKTADHARALDLLRERLKL